MDFAGPFWTPENNLGTFSALNGGGVLVLGTGRTRPGFRSKQFSLVPLFNSSLHLPPQLKETPHFHSSLHL